MSFLLALDTVDKIIGKGNQLISDGNVEVKERKIIPYHCNLAPSFGKLKDGSSYKLMDDNLKIIIVGTTKKLSQMIQEAQKNNTEISWEDVVSAMSTNSLLEPIDDSAITRSDKLIKDDMNYFKFDGSPDPNIVREVHTWFVNLLKDEDVLRDTQIDIDTLGKIVAQSGATITNFDEVFYKREYHENKVMDIGVLRYPDIDHPYFKVYRIVLTAWSDSERIVFVQHDTNGITGTFNSRKYKPRDSVIAGISQATKDKAVKEAEDLLNSIL